MASSTPPPPPLVEDFFPESVEEAAALLGATTITMSQSPAEATLVPPAGMHPAFVVTQSEIATELVSRLYVLRALLRTVQSKTKQQQAAASGAKQGPSAAALPAAPSILQVLKKLLGISTQLGAAAHSMTVAGGMEPPSRKRGGGSTRMKKKQHATPPLLSTPCRKLWVDCVVLCHVLSSSSSGSSNGSDLTQFVRQMLVLASVHPRSQKAAGGVRIAALEVVAALMEGDTENGAVNENNNSNNKRFPLASQLAPWSLDVLQVCLKALRSAGNGEPTYRQAAVRAACATATACLRAAKPASEDNSNSDPSLLLLLPGAMEDKAVVGSHQGAATGRHRQVPRSAECGRDLGGALGPALGALDE